jgi:hypothetical protein
MAVIDMPRNQDKPGLRRDLLIAGALFVAGVVVSGLSLARIRADNLAQVAQATGPLQGTPSDDNSKTPAEAKPGGERPTTPAPEPAQPDPQTQGVAKPPRPVLPQTPAEKIGRPINEPAAKDPQTK